MDDMQWDTERRRPWQPPAVKPAAAPTSASRTRARRTGPKDARAASPAARTLSKDIETSAIMTCPPLAARAWHAARTANAIRTHRDPQWRALDKLISPMRAARLSVSSRRRGLGPIAPIPTSSRSAGRSFPRGRPANSPRSLPGPRRTWTRSAERKCDLSSTRAGFHGPHPRQLAIGWPTFTRADAATADVLPRSGLPPLPSL